MTKPKSRAAKGTEFGDTARERLATNLRSLRNSQDLSQETLAELANFHRTFVSQVERGKNNIALDNVEKLAKALNVDIQELLARPRK